MTRGQVDWWVVGGAAGIALAVVLVVWCIVFEIAHPCVRWVESTCSECVSEMMLPDSEGQPTIPVCFAYEDHPCQRCAERAP